MLTANDCYSTWQQDYTRHLRRTGKSEQTIKLYLRVLDAFCRSISPLLLESVTHRHINAWIDELIEATSSSNADICFRNLRPFFGWLSNELDQPNPMTRADKPKAPLSDIPVLPLADVQKLIQGCNGRSFIDRRDTALIRLLFDTGARPGEVTSLSVESWNRATDMIRLRGKTGTRDVPLSPSTGEALARYVRLRASQSHAESLSLWLGSKGPLTSSGLSQVLARRSRQVGLSRVYPYLARHWFAHQFRLQGGSETDLCYLMGWTSTAMAMRYGRSAASVRAQRASRAIQIGDLL